LVDTGFARLEGIERDLRTRDPRHRKRHYIITDAIAEMEWWAYSVMAKLGVSFEEMANPAWFKENPHLGWAFYGTPAEPLPKTVPHHGFSRELLELGSAKPGGYFFSRRTWTGNSSEAVSRRREWSSATASFTTFNAPHPVLMRFGIQKVKP
jgi:hypothetical protein